MSSIRLLRFRHKNVESESVETQRHPHQPVLLEQTIAVLQPTQGDRYLDLTAGYGGHASAILDSTRAWNQAVLVDRDAAATKRLQMRFHAPKNRMPRIWHIDMVSALQRLRRDQSHFDVVLLDLGVSSVHFDEAKRGFSFRRQGPLDMRMDQRQSLTAETVVNQWPETELCRLIADYGEEPHARRIAQAIVKARPLYRTDQLAETVAKAIGRRGKRHPATRTFQAIRLAVNQELTQLGSALQYLPNVLAPGGRLAIISFHSLEDRLVKRAFRQWTNRGLESQFRLLTKRPITAGQNEIVLNPRARSAKLRAVAKLTNTPKERSMDNAD